MRLTGFEPSGPDTQEIEGRAVAAGPGRFLAKPFERIEVLQRVRESLQAKQRQDRLRNESRPRD